MIAILSSNLDDTLKWAKENFEIVAINRSGRKFRTSDNKEYLIVSLIDHAFGREFESYIKAPDFETLEDIVRSRIR